MTEPPMTGPDRPLAAIDCGTNSTRLLVADPGGPSLERLVRITRLGQGVDRTKILAPEAIDRTVAVLEEYRTVLDRFGVEQVRMTATSAARDASNREEFFAAAEKVVGVRPELIGGDEEGRLSFAGATSELNPASGPWLVVDIGGGSTELAVGPGPDGGPLAVRSLDVGCVRLTERFLLSDPPEPGQVDEACRFVSALLEDLTSAQPEFRGGSTLVGLAGTVAALASIEQGLTTYDRARVHHHTLTRASVDQLLATLAAESTEARKERPGMETERADVIVGGAVVLGELMTHFGFDACLTSEADILDGLVLSQRVP